MTGKLLFYTSVVLLFHHASTIKTALSGKKVCIVGGGPVGYYFAARLLHEDDSVQIEIIERSSRVSKTRNAFGIGVNKRMRQYLAEVTGLEECVVAKSAPTGMPGRSIISRVDLCEEMIKYLEQKYNRKQVKVMFNEECQRIDLDKNQIQTSRGRTLHYDFLVGSDGVNSSIRRQLGIQEEHYISPTKWKALRLPSQSDLQIEPMRSMIHPAIMAGRVLPAYPEGHIMLLFWKEDFDNPGNVTNASDLKSLLTESVQIKPKTSLVKRSFGTKPERTIEFDDKAVKEFLESPSGQSHYLRVERFHDRNVALIGDAAHGMYNLLGQGCTMGLLGASILVANIVKSAKLRDALEAYTNEALPEAHAITDLNLIGHARSKNPLISLCFAIMTLIQLILGKTIFKRLADVSVPYTSLLRENKLIVNLCKLQWRRERIAFTVSKN